MQYEIYGTNDKLSDQQISVALEYYAKLLFSKKERKKLKLEITFEPKDDVKRWIGCMWFDCEEKYPYKIWIRPTRSVDAQLDALAHELVHIWQMERGDMCRLEGDIKSKRYAKWPKAKDKYWDNPLEIEAFGRAIGMKVRLLSEYPDLRKVKK